MDDQEQSRPPIRPKQQPPGRLLTLMGGSLAVLVLLAVSFPFWPADQQEAAKRFPRTSIAAYRSLPYFLKDLPKTLADPGKQALLASAEWQIIEAERYAILGEYLKAHDAFEAAVKSTTESIGPEAPITCLFLMRQASFEDSYHKANRAENCMRKALVGLPRNGPNEQVYLMAKVSLGRLLEVQGKYPEAMAIMLESLALAKDIDRQSPELCQENTKIVLRSLARCHIHNIEFDKAYDSCLQVLGICQQYQQNKDEIATALIDLGNLRTYPSDFVTAIGFYNQAMAISGENPEIYCQRGKALNAIGEYRQAIADFSFAIGKNSKNVSARHGRATAYEKIGQPEKAIDDLTIAIDCTNDRGVMQYQRSTIYQSLNQRHQEGRH